MDQQEAKKLIDKYVQGTATPQECKLVENWYQSMSDQRPLSDRDDFEHLADELWAGTLQKANLTAPRKTVRLWPYITVAASICLFIVVGLNFFLHKKTNTEAPIARIENKKSTILPGGNKAVLTLGNGQQISLSDQKNGTIAKDNTAEISKTGDGQVNYQAASANSAITYNTLTTPKGGQYTVVLADGTKVVLNAASSLKYPTSFSGNSRVVELTGEGYFEVAHNKAKPFRVMSNGQTIEVLGTHFNINAYNDEPSIKTTLLVGSVKVTAGNTNVMLKPGEQSQLSLNDAEHHISVATVNTEEAVAWKNGLFEFNNASVKEVMKCAARWYDIDVNYSHNYVPKVRITGRMSRNVDLSGLVQLLRFEGIKLNVNGKKVEVIDQE